MSPNLLANMRGKLFSLTFLLFVINTSAPKDGNDRRGIGDSVGQLGDGGVAMPMIEDQVSELVEDNVHPMDLGCTRVIEDVVGGNCADPQPCWQTACSGIPCIENYRAA